MNKVEQCSLLRNASITNYRVCKLHKIHLLYTKSRTRFVKFSSLSVDFHLLYIIPVAR